MDCWGALVGFDGSGAAQRIKVVKRGGGVIAGRAGKVYYGDLSQEQQQHESGGEWAI